MGKKYEAIVIGAGLGGLSSATFLAKNGIKTLLLERHNVPGGYSTSFVRGRFEFEAALHELSGVGTPEKPGPMLRYIQDLGVADLVTFRKTHHMYKSIFPDMSLDMPNGREAYEETLCDAFPHEADNIRRFMGRVFDLFRETSQLQKENLAGFVSPANIAKVVVKYRHAIRYNFATWGQVLYRDIKDPKARAVLSQYWGYFGMAPSEISFMYFAIGLASYLKHGAAFPEGRSQALSNAFIKTFEHYGGEARFNCGVDKILVENGRVKGVITDDEQSFDADFVVSNADPIATCREMIGESEVPTSFFDRLRTASVAPSTLNCYLGLAKSAEELGITDHEAFINKDADFDSHAKMLHKLEPPKGMAFTCYNMVLPEITPVGTCQVVLTCLSYGDAWLRLDPGEYVDTKNRLADAMLDFAEQHYPGLRENLEVIEVSTPLTNMRYANALGGSIYGFNNTPGENTVWRIPQKGPVGGLYFAGAWTQPGGGFEPTIMSGQMAGDLILRKFKRA